METVCVSVIVPVYNVEKYVDICIESILKQTYSNIEVIIVDDGSTDSSGEKCDKWALKDNRIKIIHKKNEGLGYARNTGLKEVTGEYVIFVDSDDFISEVMIERLIASIHYYEVDTVYCGWNRYRGTDNIIKTNLRIDKTTFQGNKILSEVLGEMVATKPYELEDCYFWMSVWHGIYSMDIIKKNNIFFPSERELISEDIIFHIDYLKNSLGVALIADNLYFYRENNISLTSIYNPKRFEKEVILYKEVVNRLQEIKNIEDFDLRAKRMFLGRVRSCIMRGTLEPNINIHDEIKKICNDECVKSVIETYPFNENPFKHRLFNTLVYKKNYLFIYVIAKIMAKRNLAHIKCENN